MKKLTIILFAAFGFTAYGQTFQWDTNDTIETNLTPNTTEQYPTYQSAIGQDTVTLAIEVIYNDIPASWDGMLCIYGVCLGIIPPVGTQATMNPIYGSIQGMVRLTVNPYNGTEEAKLQVYVYDVNFPNDGDTATFLLNTTLGVDEMNAGSLTIAPNPASEVLKVECENQMDHVAIYNAEGREVKNIALSNAFASEIYVGDLPAGVYMLQTSGSGSTVQQRFVKR